MEIDVVLPCLNEAGALPWVLSRMPNGFRPIVADNGSTDDSAAVAAAHGALVVHVSQRGFGAACHAGLLAATSDIVCVMDADASFDPGDLPLVADPIATGAADLMLGRRSMRGKGAWPLHARVGNRVLAAELRRRIGVSVRDLGPMRAARRESLLRLPAGDGGPRRRGGLADRGDGRAVLPADRQVEGHRHARRHRAGRQGHAPGARLHHGTGPGRHAGPRRHADPGRHAGLVVTAADVYTGRHRRPGGPGAAGVAGAADPDRPAWTRAGRLLAAQVVVIAKEPVPGRVKTRLTPPFTPRQAAELAEASLADTLAAVADTTVARRVLALDGTPGSWLRGGFDVIGQRGAGLDERIAWALADARVTLPLPVVLIGMDTPQVTPALLAAAAAPLVDKTADATFGMAEDGGFWLLGLREVDSALILGVPMSQPDTGPRQLARLEEAGLRIAMLPELTDVDTVREAERVAALTPGSRFAACLARLHEGARQPVTPAVAGAR